MKTINNTEIKNDQLTGVTGGINSCDPALLGKGIIIKEAGEMKSCDPPFTKAGALASVAIMPPKAIIKEK